MVAAYGHAARHGCGDQIHAGKRLIGLVYRQCSPFQFAFYKLQPQVLPMQKGEQISASQCEIKLTIRLLGLRGCLMPRGEVRQSPTREQP